MPGLLYPSFIQLWYLRKPHSGENRKNLKPASSTVYANALEVRVSVSSLFFFIVIVNSFNTVSEEECGRWKKEERKRRKWRKRRKRRKQLGLILRRLRPLSLLSGLSDWHLGSVSWLGTAAADSIPAAFSTFFSFSTFYSFSLLSCNTVKWEPLMSYMCNSIYLMFHDCWKDNLYWLFEFFTSF